MLVELLLVVMHCVPPGPSEAVGLWELAPGSSGIGHAIELRSDGSFAETMTVMVDMTYRLSADGLSILQDSKTATESTATPFKVTTGTLRFLDQKRKKVKMVRVGAPPDPTSLVLGVWRYRHYTGGTAFERYSPDGRLLFRLPLPGAETGCFTVVTDAVSLAYAEGPMVLRQASRDVLKQAGEEEHPFERAEGGTWYPLTANERP